MNPNNRQVYTCISSADKLCILHTVSIHLFFRNGGVKVWGSQGWGDWICLGLGVGVGVWICFFVKFSLKPNPSSSQSTIVFFPQKQRWREMCKSPMFSLERKYWKEMLFKREWLCKSLFIHRLEVFSCLPFTFPKDVCCFFTPQLFGYSPPLSPRVFSPPPKIRSPSHLSSSFLVCFK